MAQSSVAEDLGKYRRQFKYQDKPYSPLLPSLVSDLGTEELVQKLGLLFVGKNHRLAIGGASR